ncbi:ribosomal protein S7 domain-containing protein [Geopyxis carbonaria]|nr:ribosomal protein S7 domain-containing protein [Geopyxis carbonaria]
MLRSRRLFASKSSTTPTSPPTGPTRDVLPHVSEEAAATAKITGETPPEIDQGTPISEVLQRDPKAMKNAPTIIKNEIPGSKRQYSTVNAPVEPPKPIDEVIVHAGIPHGAKFPLPDLPLPSTAHLRRRYAPIVEQVTNLIMRDGKKASAQSTMTEVLAILRTKPAPKENPRIPIIPTAPPLASLPSDPVAYLQTAIDSVAPLLKIKQVKGSGGFRESLPMPLPLRQRRRKAVTWIIEAADKRKVRMGLAERLAEEIVAVVEGKSTAWDKRLQVHRTAVAARANVKVKVM